MANLSPQTREKLHNRFYYIPQIVALCVVAPFVWLAMDRTPPLELYDGRIEPAVVRPGQTDVKVTWRARFSGRDCPGLSQRELVDSQKNLWPKLRRSRSGVFHPNADDPLDGYVTTPPLDIPSQMEPGPAFYRVTQFYYCNDLQRILHWPIVARSVPIAFVVKDEE